MKKCPKCEKTNSAYAGICEFCGADISRTHSGEGDRVEIADIPVDEPDSKDIGPGIEKATTIENEANLDNIYRQLEEIKGQLAKGSTLFDVNMPFGRMVMLFIKIILAAIPAVMIVGFLFSLFWAFLGGLIFNLFFRGFGIQ
jgi:hypothetical protein